MTVYSLYPPIALATVVNTFLFALLWRGQQTEMRTGEPPLWMVVLLLCYIGGIAAFFYWAGTPQKANGLYVFMSAMGGEAFGGAVTFGILRAIYFTRGMPKAEIVAAYVMAIGLLSLLIWLTIAS